jgi:hypothetical protein
MLKVEGSVALALLFCSTTALAQDVDSALAAELAPVDEPPQGLQVQPVEPDQPKPEPSPTPSSSKASQAAREGLLSPFTSPAAISRSRAFAQSYVGYDGAAAETRARVATEGKLTNFLSLRVEFEHGPATGTENRLTLGARFGILTQQQFGVDLGAAVFYQPKDFRDEGNVVGGVLLARRFGRLGLFGNALFGSDPEGDDQSAELRLGSLYAANDWFSVGIDARSRWNFSQDAKRAQARSVDWEMQAAPTAILCWGSFSLMALLGPSLVQMTAPNSAANAGSYTRAGLLAMGGAGGAF